MRSGHCQNPVPPRDAPLNLELMAERHHHRCPWLAKQDRVLLRDWPYVHVSGPAQPFVILGLGGLHSGVVNIFSGWPRGSLSVQTVAAGLSGLSGREPELVQVGRVGELRRLTVAVIWVARNGRATRPGLSRPVFLPGWAFEDEPRGSRRGRSVIRTSSRQTWFPVSRCSRLRRYLVMPIIARSAGIKG